MYSGRATAVTTRMKRVISTSVAALLLTTLGSACPVCDSALGQEVRAGIFDGRFALTWLEVIAPFPILALILAAMHWGLRD